MPPRLSMLTAVRTHRLCVLGSNRAPGEILFLRPAAALRQRRAIRRIAQDARQGRPEFLSSLLRHQHYPGLRDGGCRLPALARDDRQTAGNPRDRAASPRRDWPPRQNENIRETPNADD